MSNYYVPTINEFIIDFEYERTDDYKNWFKKTCDVYDLMDIKILINKEIFEESSVEERILLLNENIHKRVVNNKRLSRIRVKYLDEEDILSLGFKENIHSYGKNYIKDNYILSYTYDNKHIEISKENIGRIFLGTIRNKFELKRLLSILYEN